MIPMTSLRDNVANLITKGNRFESRSACDEIRRTGHLLIPDTGNGQVKDLSYVKHSQVRSDLSTGQPIHSIWTGLGITFCS